MNKILILTLVLNFSSLAGASVKTVNRAQANPERWSAIPALKVSIENRFNMDIGNIWMQARHLKNGKFSGQGILVSASGLYCIPQAGLMTYINCFSADGNFLGAVETRLSDI